MKTRIHKTIRVVLGFILTLLGCSGCRIVPAAEYGCPTADYKLQGTVTDSRTKQPIKGIRVVCAFGGLNDEWGYKDTLYTDATGKISKDYPSMTAFSNDIQVLLEDIDGFDNGTYEPLLLEKENLPVKQMKEGDGKWYGGVYTITADAELNEYIPPAR